MTTARVALKKQLKPVRVEYRFEGLPIDIEVSNSGVVDRPESAQTDGYHYYHFCVRLPL